MLGTHLAVRPRPMELESTIGYLLRIAMANGLPSIRGLYHACCSSASPFDELRRLLVLKDAEALQLFGPLPACWGQFHSLRGLSVSDFVHSHRRWCPLCLVDRPYQQGRWDLKLVTLCTHHRVWLRDRCPRCGAKQPWTASSLQHCSCGSDLSMGFPEAAGLPVVELTKALQEDLKPTANDVTALPAAAILSQTQSHRLVRTLGQFFPGVNQPSRPGQIARLDDLDVARSIVENTAHLLDEWPAQFFRLLEDIQKAAGPSNSLKRSFGGLYRLLYVELDDPAFQFLRDAFEEHLKTNWWGVVCRRNSRLKASTLESRVRMTTKQAYQATGIWPSTLQHLVQLELLQAQDVPLPSGRKARTFRHVDITAAAEALEGAANLTRLARHARLAERRIRDLVELRVLNPIVSRSGGSSWLFSAADFKRMQIPTVECASAGTPLVTVGTLLKSARLKSSEGASLIAAILARELRALSPSGGITRVGDVMLDADEATRWRESWRHQHCAPLSIPKAAKELHLKQEVVYHLIKSTLLRAKRDSGGWRVDWTGLEDFQRQFVALSELARAKHTSPRHLMSSLTVQPVTGPKIDRGRQYFFRRDDVADLLA